MVLKYSASIYSKFRNASSFNNSYTSSDRTLLLVNKILFRIKNILYFLEHAESIDAVGKRTKRFNKCTRIYIIVSRIIFLLATLSIFALPTSLLDEYNTV